MKKKIIVIGDVMIDWYLHGESSRISPEAPVPVVNFKESKFQLGGAANVANNLKHLYIYFVNSLNHTGKDTLIKIPSNLVREKHFNKSNIYLEFSPVDMWCHSLIEYTALESNIYFSNLMYLISINKVRVKGQMYIFDYKRIVQLNEKLGKKKC